MIQPRGGASLQVELSVKSACGVNDNINVNVTVGMETACDDLLSVIFTKNSENQCNNSNNHNNVRLNRCKIVRSSVADDSGKRVCSMKCKCADSAGSCDIQVYSYSGVASTQQNVRICEISVGVEGWNRLFESRSIFAISYHSILVYRYHLSKICRIDSDFLHIFKIVTIANFVAADPGFPRQGATPKGVRQPVILAMFSWKQHGIEIKIGGHAGIPPPPPRGDLLQCMLGMSLGLPSLLPHPPMLCVTIFTVSFFICTPWR